LLLIVEAAFSFSFSSKQKAAVLNEPEAIVVTPSVVVKSSPDAAGTELFLIHEGLKIKVTNHNGDWSEIRLSDGNKGWVKSEDLLVI
ncbi:MAG: SH3 domain-containing protein, partial [Salinivirgaceae bacterium]|nr:SH3 domain-containing protein [Salinivirgaceae bacterium]